jgi:hypothetical protein
LLAAAYAKAFNEVKTVGRAVSAARTPEQTRFAQLFAGVGPFMNVTSPFRLWSNVAPICSAITCGPIARRVIDTASEAPRERVDVVTFVPEGSPAAPCGAKTAIASETVMSRGSAAVRSVFSAGRAAPPGSVVELPGEADASPHGGA